MISTNSFSKNNSVSLVAGFPELIAVRYDREFNGFRAGINPGILYYLFSENKIIAPAIYFDRDFLNWGNTLFSGELIAAYIYDLPAGRVSSPAWIPTRTDFALIGMRAGITNTNTENNVILTLKLGLNAPFSQETRNDGFVVRPFQFDIERIFSGSLSIGKKF
jgi:hypothetical protein